MDYKTEILSLIDKYTQLLHDHQIPIDRTTKEQYSLEGTDRTLKNVIFDLREVLRNVVDENDKAKYTE
jgi:hypothetical protein